MREDFANGAETGNAAIVIDSEDLQFNWQEIQVNRLDDISDSFGLGRIDFIKADIDGHEDRFLAGAVNAVHRSRPILLWKLTRFITSGKA